MIPQMRYKVFINHFNLIHTEYNDNDINQAKSGYDIVLPK
jgi:hypothetical protein